MPRPFRPPRPNYFLMWALGFLSRWALLKGYFRIRTLDLPRADRVRLRAAVNTDTAAFVGPNHPEFGFDWIMDKEISTRVAPRIACWASQEIVESAPWFWSRNNLIGHNGAAAATDFSVDWALRGNGVLLHPEGSVHWTADRIHPLYHGIAEMACDAARRANGRPVYIVPIVWKVCYVDDVGRELHREMEIIERHLALPDNGQLGLIERFRALQEDILTKQMRAHGFNPGSVVGRDFFASQEAFRDRLIEDLESRYPIEPVDSIERTINRLKRAIPAEQRADRAKAEEASRLMGFSREDYSTPMLSQEQIAESLKRHRATLVRSGLRNAAHNVLPTPHGPRIAHVRVPEPILVDPLRAAPSAGERSDYVLSLIELTRRRMQEGIDAIKRESRPEVERFAYRNPFAPQPYFLSTADRISASVLPSLA